MAHGLERFSLEFRIRSIRRIVTLADRCAGDREDSQLWRWANNIAAGNPPIADGILHTGEENQQIDVPRQRVQLVRQCLHPTRAHLWVMF